MGCEEMLPCAKPRGWRWLFRWHRWGPTERFKCFSGEARLKKCLYCGEEDFECDCPSGEDEP